MKIRLNIKKVSSTLKKEIIAEKFFTVRKNPTIFIFLWEFVLRFSEDKNLF